MKVTNFKSFLSQIYLILVPILTVIFGLTTGYISYKVYLPIWLTNIFFMTLAIRTITATTLKINDREKKRLISCAIFFIIPTMLTSMFFGLGAPPYESPKSWVNSITEQRIRYYFLLIAGLFISFGFTILRQKLKKTGDDFFSSIGDAAIRIAIPIFLVNMTFWGFYLTRLYQSMVAGNMDKIPEWVIPLRTQFYYINIIVCGLIYLGSAAFIMALRRTALFSKLSCNVFLVIISLFFILDVLPPSLPDPFATLNFIVSIPAVPFYFPYFIGIKLLRRATI